MNDIQPWLRPLLRCPDCRAELRDEQRDSAPALACTGCALTYRIEDGIPVLLVDEAVRE